MQRPACRSGSPPANSVYTSRQSWILTSTGRRCAVCRGVVMNPRGSAMVASSAGRGGHDGRVHVTALPLGLPGGGEHPLVVLGHHPAEPGQRRVPVGPQTGRDRRAGLGEMPPEEFREELAVAA